MEKLKCPNACTHYLEAAGRYWSTEKEPSVKDKTCPNIPYPVPVGCPFMMDVKRLFKQEMEERHK
jgi:hypothetical protein